jgi:hypothetical protein
MDEIHRMIWDSPGGDVVEMKYEEKTRLKMTV